ncbi:UpxY family transcription antiterminator [Balneolaceae bacterium ANBcel3]|nr:UpxY family transcription antiterminator [Balneolaceae bacterium ANBcel3]
MNIVRWYALYTRARFEKKVSEELTDRGYEPWLPMQTVIREWSDRKKKVQVPLFSGYVFLRSHKNKLREAVTVNGVARAVMFNGEPAVIREDQIELIRKVLEGPDAFEVKEKNFTKGEPVLVEYGPLKGCCGLWLRWKGKKRVCIQLEQLKKSIIVEVPAAYVTRLNTESEFENYSTIAGIPG